MAKTYKSQIMAWDWARIIKRARLNVETDYEGNTVGREFLGTVFALYPSGKYYTPFANSNVTEAEAAKDERFGAALEEIAQKHGGWIESGEGDPCDIFFALPCEETA